MRNFSSFKTTILNNNLKGREEVLTHIAEPSSRNSAKKPKPFVFPVGSGQVRPTNQFR